jgi:hypothetical protein
MASTNFFVSQTDARGGAGANFIVKWAANTLANKPVIEAVMVGLIFLRYCNNLHY